MHEGGNGFSDDGPGEDLGPLVTAFEAVHEFEAHTVAAVLADAGIRAFVFSGGALGYSDPVFGMRGGVPVQVAESQLESARAALKQAKYIGASIDWDSVDVGEPEPQSKAVTTFVQVFVRGMFAAGWLVGVVCVVLAVVAVIQYLSR